MSAERWAQIKKALAQVLDAPESRRTEAIRNACAGDPGIESEVRGLLAQTIGPSCGEFGYTTATETTGGSDESDLLLQAGNAIAGRFRLVRLLGRGGMGQVWEAFDGQLRVSVAIKTLRPELLSDDRAVARFQRELLTARGVTHPHICRVYDLCVHESGARLIPFLTMQLIGGESLAERLKRKPLTGAEALVVLQQCASALDAAHRAGVIHRDFKPGNIMLASDDSDRLAATVMDFGLARLTHSEEVGAVTAAGTPGYMPPEQLAGKEAEPSADVYSFAVVACELLTGKRPFDGGLEALSPRWRGPIRKALDVEPGKRIASPTALLDAVKAGKKGLRLLAAALTITLLATLVLWAAVRSPLFPKPEPTVAVLPFDVATQDPALQYLGDGIAEELIDSLTRWPGLHVIARGSSFSFRGPNSNPKRVSQTLGATYVVVGSVRRQGGHVRIGVELVDPKNGFQIWASTFDRPEGEIFEVHEILASEIASRLGGNQGHPSIRRQPQTIDPVAHDLYLRGLFHFNQRTREQTLMALDLLQQAIQRAPDYAQLYTALADCYSVMGDYYFKPPLEIAEPAHAAIQQALRLDPDSAEAHASLGLWANLYGWNNRLAETNFREAIRLNAGYVSAHQWYSQLLFKTRRFDEAGREARRALDLDPISPAVNLSYGNLLFYSRDFAGLVKQSMRLHEINPALPFSTNHRALGLAYLGRISEAVATMAAAKPMLGSDPVAIRIWAEILAVGGDKPRAREGLDRLIGLYQEGKAAASFPAMIYAALGEPDRACDYLEKAVEQLDTNLTVMDVAPPYDVLRKNPRFLSIRAKVFKETTATY